MPIGHRWSKGQSGNPGGRRKMPITEALAKKLTPQKAEAFADLVLEMAFNGDSWAMQFVADRLEGKAVARNENGEPGDFDRLQIKLKLVKGTDGDTNG